MTQAVGLARLVETARKERHEVTPEDVLNGVVGWVEFAARMRNSADWAIDPKTRDAQAVAIAKLIAFCVEFAEPMAVLPVAKTDWRQTVHLIARESGL